MKKKYKFATPQRIEMYKGFKLTLNVPQLNEVIDKNIQPLKRAHYQLMNKYRNTFNQLRNNAFRYRIEENK